MENRMRKWTKRQVFTYTALLILLAVRFPIGDFVSNLSQLINVTALSSWIDALRSVQNWTFYLWERFSFVLVGIVILVNRSDLKKINIDRSFLALFVISGILFCGYSFWPLGWMGVLISGYIVYLVSKNEINFENDSRPNSLLPIIILVLLFFLSFLLQNVALNVATFNTIIQNISDQLPFLLAEEVIFRGLLWVCLKELGWSELVIIIVQAMLFWFFHIYYMFSEPVLFWLIVPATSMFLGILVWKYKSITPSLVAHILFNLRP